MNKFYFVRFDSTVAPLVYADQFLQISSRLSSEFLYGLGEHKAKLLHNASIWQQYALWAKDEHPTVSACGHWARNLVIL